MNKKHYFTKISLLLATLLGHYQFCAAAEAAPLALRNSPLAEEFDAGSPEIQPNRKRKRDRSIGKIPASTANQRLFFMNEDNNLLDIEHFIEAQKKIAQTKPYSCNRCGAKHAKSSTCITHIKNKHQGQGYVVKGNKKIRTRVKSYQCDCGYFANDNAALEMHKRTHSKEKPFQCPECPKRFAQNALLVIHMRSHTGEKPFQCSTCEKKFADPSNANTHLKNVHKKNGTIIKI